MKEFWKRFWQEEDGVEVIELVVIVAILMAVALIFRNRITAFVNDLADQLFTVPDILINLKIIEDLRDFARLTGRASISRADSSRL